MLRAGQRVRVTVAETAVMEGEVIQDGRLRLRNDAWTGKIEAPQPGGIVTVWVNGETLASAELYSDYDSSASIVEGDTPDAVLPRTARILKKSNAKPVGLAFVAFGLAAGYFAWQDGAAPVALGLLGLFPLAGVYLLFSQTTNILYTDNGRLGWYSRFNRQLRSEQVPIGEIQSLKIKPYRFGRRHGRYQVVIGLADGYELPLPENLFGGNVVRYVEKRLLAELRKFKPSIEFTVEEPVKGRPKNRVRLPAGQ
jgi:hypothetical protein